MSKRTNMGKRTNMSKRSNVSERTSRIQLSRLRGPERSEVVA